MLGRSRFRSRFRFGASPATTLVREIVARNGAFIVARDGSEIVGR